MKTRPSTRRARTRARRRCARRCSPTSPRRSRSACCPCGTSTRSARTPRCAPACNCARPTHALGKMIQAQQQDVPFLVTGTDYPTRDGSGIRDYIHVWDLAAAHVAALGRFDALPGPATAINLGTGRGTTVRELADAFNRVADSPIKVREAGGGRVTSSAPTPASAARSAFSAGVHGTTSPMGSVIRFSGPRSVTRSCPVTRLRGSGGSVLWSADPAFGSRRSSCPIRGRSGCSACTPRRY